MLQYSGKHNNLGGISPRSKVKYYQKGVIKAIEEDPKAEIPKKPRKATIHV